MSPREPVRRIARRMPADLRELRGKLMLEGLCVTLGVQEVACPACRGSGWLDRAALERCPVCLGFLEVPDRLADWFGAQLRAAGAASVRPMRQGLLRAVGVPDGERYGRLAELHYRVHLPAWLLDEVAEGLAGGVSDVRPAQC